MPSTLKSNERLFCWEQVHATNPLFRISRVFAPPEHAEQLLPLYALFSVLEQLCSQASDLDLARSKLEWWRSECLQRSLAASGHPILKEINRTGAVQTSDLPLLAELFAAAESRLDATAPAELDDLERLCHCLHEPQYLLESRLCAADPSGKSPVPDGTCARNGLVQLIRESAGPGRTGRYWWLPLKLLARHGVSRTELGTTPDLPAARALFEEVLEQAQHWAGRGSGQRGRASAATQAPRHFLVFSHLQTRLLGRLKDSRPSQYATTLRRVGSAELIWAWRAARHVSRP